MVIVFTVQLFRKRWIVDSICMSVWIIKECHSERVRSDPKEEERMTLKVPVKSWPKCGIIGMPAGRNIQGNVEQSGPYVKNVHPYKYPLLEELLPKIKPKENYRVVDCTLEVPTNSRDNFREFPPIFKNMEIGREDIGPYMKEIAQEDRLFENKLRRKLISGFHLSRSPIITLIFIFYIRKV